MYIQGNTVARSRNHHCIREATVHFERIIELHVTVNYINILRVAQENFYRKFMFPATIKLI